MRLIYTPQVQAHEVGLHRWKRAAPLPIGAGTSLDFGLGGHRVALTLEDRRDARFPPVSPDPRRGCDLRSVIRVGRRYEWCPFDGGLQQPGWENQAQQRKEDGSTHVR